MNDYPSPGSENNPIESVRSTADLALPPDGQDMVDYGLVRPGTAEGGPIEGEIVDGEVVDDDDIFAEAEAETLGFGDLLALGLLAGAVKAVAESQDDEPAQPTRQPNSTAPAASARESTESLLDSVKAGLQEMRETVGHIATMKRLVREGKDVNGRSPMAFGLADFEQYAPDSPEEVALIASQAHIFADEMFDKHKQYICEEQNADSTPLRVLELEAQTADGSVHFRLGGDEIHVNFVPNADKAGTPTHARYHFVTQETGEGNTQTALRRDTMPRMESALPADGEVSARAKNRMRQELRETRELELAALRAKGENDNVPSYAEWSYVVGHLYGAKAVKATIDTVYDIADRQSPGGVPTSEDAQAAGQTFVEKLNGYLNNNGASPYDEIQAMGVPQLTSLIKTDGVHIRRDFAIGSEGLFLSPSVEFNGVRAVDDQHAQYAGEQVGARFYINDGTGELRAELTQGYVDASGTLHERRVRDIRADAAHVNAIMRMVRTLKSKSQNA